MPILADNFMLFYLILGIILLSFALIIHADIVQSKKKH